MTRDQLFKTHHEICQQALEIMKLKNHDYSGADGNNPFANFTRSEAMGICSTEQGFLVRICDKLSRLSTFANNGELKVDNESYQDAILDIINYCILFYAYSSSKPPTPPQESQQN
tara:strand:- start:792 stop:1136 length:345 start_codon:yes stop_codon:yes gene_type:complete